jgi:hypothetical protein
MNRVALSSLVGEGDELVDLGIPTPPERGCG